MPTSRHRFMACLPLCIQNLSPKSWVRGPKTESAAVVIQIAPDILHPANYRASHMREMIVMDNIDVYCSANARVVVGLVVAPTRQSR